MPLDPSLNVTGDPDIVKVSATDIAGASECGRFLALKTRPAIKVVDGWSRLFAHGARVRPCPSLTLPLLSSRLTGILSIRMNPQATWLGGALDERKIHRLLQPYIRLAVDNVLEAHESIEAELGPLRLLAADLSVGTADRRLAAWGPVYEAAGGVREIRRFRMGSVRADENSVRWSVIAAYVAAVHRRLALPGVYRVARCRDRRARWQQRVLFDGTAVVRSSWLMGGAVLPLLLTMTTWCLAGRTVTARPQALAGLSSRSTGCSGSISAASVHARLLPASLSSM